jgi:hypothetical protein
MDITVLVSVGSFVVSERVLKPKASLLVILGCVLAYDLTTKTHDTSSLRVYRGPGLLAFTLMMVAYSLRTWRRNGVACDELLFLPGTPHADLHDDHLNNNNNHSLEGGSSHNRNNHNRTSAIPMTQMMRSEGDVAAGGGWSNAANANATASTHKISSPRTTNEVEMTPQQQQQLQSLKSSSGRFRARSLSQDSSLSSINELFTNTWEIHQEDDTRNEDKNWDGVASHENIQNKNGQEDPLDDDDSDGDNEDDEENLMLPLNIDVNRSRTQMSDSERSMHAIRNPNNGGNAAPHGHTRAERFRENHPQITRIGSFFFFRSSSTSTHNAAYAPSGPSVVGAALDLSMPVLINFHLFISAFNHLDTYETETPAKILPLIFLSVLIVRSVFPPGRRGRFWNTIRHTAGAPFHRRKLRDVYLGDVLTSLVRPIQDVVFALAYYFTVIWGTLTSKYGLSECGHVLETSWILHNVVLPSCALLPLWWKFLQTLREAYDTGKRWPHLGNAFKYLSAALVILYGMTHPENRRSPWWILAFAAALVYQILWDTLVDWELFVLSPNEGEIEMCEPSWCAAPRISSVRPTSYWILTIQRLILQPIGELMRTINSRISIYKQIHLRPQRLYKTDKFYWKIFFFNTMFRFTWMLSFIPAYHLSENGVDVVTTFSSDTKSYVGVLLPLCEILRRTLWGFLFLELQTIKMKHQCDPAFRYAEVETSEDIQDESDLSRASVDSSKNVSRHLPSWLGMQQQLQHDAAVMATTPSSSHWRIYNWFKYSDETRRKLYLAELFLWATAFVLLGMWATT